MTVGGYPITKITHSIKSLSQQGFEVWYWHLDGSAFDSPLQPLTQEFWQVNHNSRLAYGVVLPALVIRDRGDLFILVTQDLAKANHTRYGGLKVRQRYELYALILEIQFTHVEGMQVMPAALRHFYFHEFETTFNNSLLPKKNEAGEYYREPEKPKYEILQPDSDGKVSCSKCKQRIMPGDGLIVIDRLSVDDGSTLIFAVCEHCEESLAVRINAPSVSRQKSNGK